MKVALRQETPEPEDSFFSRTGHRRINWIRGLPFAMGKSGTLVHRVKSAQSLIHNGKYSHDVVKYWCNNGGCDRLLFDEPPEGRLMCQYCEIKAVAAGEPSTETLIGRHVHVGTMKPSRQCCKENDERN